MDPAALPPDEAIKSEEPLYRRGTLTYTKGGLFALFAWLLWGDLCFTLMEAVVPSVLPIKLKNLGCSNSLIAVFMTTLPSIFSITICPWVSYKSDRCRSRWGRRIPFMLSTLPFLSVSLILIGWTDQITGLLQRHALFLQSVSQTSIAVALLGVFIAIFSFFNMFVGSVFFYLFNDVVPPQFLGRFSGAFRMVGAATGAGYNYFVFQFAESHMREIFLGVALLYFFGFGLMCFSVKEGAYPPVEAGSLEDNKKLIPTVKTFFRESFGHKIYWLLFLFFSFTAATNSIRTFSVFFSMNMGLSLGKIGQLGAVVTAASVLSAYFAAVRVDRWHPLRVSVYLCVLEIANAGTAWIWLFVTLPQDVYFWLSLGTRVAEAFLGAFAIANTMPLFYRMFPQSKLGQFCSAQAMLASVIGLFAGVAAGLYIDVVKRFCGGSDFAYRFIFCWETFFGLVNALLMVCAYRLWHRLGGDSHFNPPAPWTACGFEEIPAVTTVGPQTRWLKMTLAIIDALLATSALGILPLLFWMRHLGANTAFFWHAWVLLPLSSLAWGYWRWNAARIRGDMARVRHGKAPQRGIMHHGMVLVASVKFLLVGLGMWITGILVTLHHSLEFGAVTFTLGNVLTNFLLVGCTQFLCWIERGYPTKLDGLLACGTP